jgi:hypothetical protein
MKVLLLEKDLSVFYVGPEKDAGPLPALIYFALSGKDSLQTDPYNQVVQFLEGAPLRVFSFSLPLHDEISPVEVLAHWSETFRKGKDFLSPFLAKLEKGLLFLIDQGWVLPEKLAVAGLSRGALIAFLIAARLPAIRVIMGFAPLIRLDAAKEFAGLDPRVLQPFDLYTQVGALYHRRIRLYIGNRDTRVGTEHAFTLIDALAKRAFKHGIRSSPIELIIGPSYGRDGHGTPPDRFRSGAVYLKKVLL